MKTKFLLFHFLLIFAPFFCFSEEDSSSVQPTSVLPDTTSEDKTLTSEEKTPVDLTGLASMQPEKKLEIPEIEAIRPEVKLPMDLWKILTLAILLLLTVIGIIAWLIKRNKQKKALPIIPVDPYQQALKALDEALQHIQQLDQRPFAFGITDAVRQYLSSVFKLPAPEYTTDEVLEKLPAIPSIPENLQQDIVHLLQQCDLAKFTKQNFEQSQRLELYKLAKNILISADKIIQLQTEKTESTQ